MKAVVLLGPILFALSAQAGLAERIEAARAETRRQLESEALRNLGDVVHSLGLSIRRSEIAEPFGCEYIARSFGECEFQWWTRRNVLLSDGRLCEVDLAIAGLTRAEEGPHRLTGVAVCFRTARGAEGFEFRSFFDSKTGTFKLNRLKKNEPKGRLE